MTVGEDMTGTLAALRVGERATVRSIGEADDALGARRLLELGFVPDAEVEVLATMWPDDDPLAVRVGGSTFALRRHEAALVRVAPMRVAPTPAAPLGARS